MMLNINTETRYFFLCDTSVTTDIIKTQKYFLSRPLLFLLLPCVLYVTAVSTPTTTIAITNNIPVITLLQLLMTMVITTTRAMTVIMIIT